MLCMFGKLVSTSLNIDHRFRDNGAMLNLKDSDVTLHFTETVLLMILICFILRRLSQFRHSCLCS